MLELINVAKTYDSPAGGAAVSVLKDINLKVDEGRSIAVVGPSGSGKSTLLNIMGALDRPTAGSVLVDGRDLARSNEAELAGIRNREIGFVFQLHHLLPQCTVIENVLVPTLAAATGGATEEAVERARHLLERVGLGDRAQYRPSRLSGGERQRAAVVRALINRPRLLLADEPTGSLDHASAERLSELLVELNREEGTALMVVTHSLELAARMERGYTLSEARLSAIDNERLARP